MLSAIYWHLIRGMDGFAWYRSAALDPPGLVEGGLGVSDLRTEGG